MVNQPNTGRKGHTEKLKKTTGSHRRCCTSVFMLETIDILLSDINTKYQFLTSFKSHVLVSLYYKQQIKQLHTQTLFFTLVSVHGLCVILHCKAFQYIK